MQRAVARYVGSGFVLSRCTRCMFQPEYTKGQLCMRRSALLACLTLAVVGLFATPGAKADSIDQFTYTVGSSTYSWQLPSTQFVGDFELFSSFTLYDVAYSVDGSSHHGDFDFYTNSEGGGFDLYTPSGTVKINAFGDQLFTGFVFFPTFLTGTYSLVDYGKFSGGQSGSLTIAPVSKAPEPSTVVFLASGLLGLFLFSRMRKTATA